MCSQYVNLAHTSLLDTFIIVLVLDNNPGWTAQLPATMATYTADMKQPLGFDQPIDNTMGSFDEVIQGDTTQDRMDMHRLGKKQEFKRNFNFISTLGFISIYMVRQFSSSSRLPAGISCAFQKAPNLRIGSDKIAGHMGIRACIPCAGTNQWRIWWFILDLYCDRHLLFFSCCQSG